MVDVSIAHILSAREERVRIQSEVSKRFHSPIISFTMNIAGPQKNSPLIERAFSLGVESLNAAIDPKKIVFKHIDKHSSTGPFAIYAVNEKAATLKDICIEIEEKTALGRLFDMDIIDESFEKLTRVRERGCIVCGAQGRACAAGRLHPLDEITAKMNQIMTAGILKNDASHIAELVTQCLVLEVKTTPKPGLVDLRNNGSHKDMTPEMFEHSANALTDYFKECVLIGNQYTDRTYTEIFSTLKNVGLDAEKRMYDTTKGVNTHKGAIFSFGILCGAIGRLWSPEFPIPSTIEILNESASIAQASINIDLKNAKGSTAGERMYLEIGASGIRGEAASGFASVLNISLPIYRDLLAAGESPNNAGAITLICLIANLNDTTIYSRGGINGLEFAKQYAKNLLQSKKIPQIAEIEEMDDIFIQRNLSAGGSADLLAVTYFLYNLEKIAATFN